jgi:hypothetical protein
MEQFAGGVTAPQLKLMLLDEAEVAISPAGAEGAAEQVVLALVVAIASADGADEPLRSTASTT